MKANLWSLEMFSIDVAKKTHNCKLGWHRLWTIHSWKIFSFWASVRRQMQCLSRRIMFCSTFCYWTAVHDPGKIPEMLEKHFCILIIHPLSLLIRCRNPSFWLAESDGSCTAGDSHARRSGHRWTSRTNGPRFVLHGRLRIRLLNLLAGVLLGWRNGPAT